MTRKTGTTTSSFLCIRWQWRTQLLYLFCYSCWSSSPRIPPQFTLRYVAMLTRPSRHAVLNGAASRVITFINTQAGLNLHGALETHALATSASRDQKRVSHDAPLWTNSNMNIHICTWKIVFGCFFCFNVWVIFYLLEKNTLRNYFLFSLLESSIGTLCKKI